MEGSRISALGSALSDGTRATAVAALLSGTAHTSGELASVCGVAASTMSGHLNKLIDAGLVRMEPAGRHRHYRIASTEVAELLERIDSLELPETEAPSRPRPGQNLSFARSCYDHLAAILTHMLDERWLTRRQDKRALTVTQTGRSNLSELFGIQL